MIEGMTPWLVAKFLFSW